MSKSFRPAAALLSLVVFQTLWAATLAPAQAAPVAAPAAVVAQR